MPELDEIKELLTEIRDDQREQLAQYKRVTQRSLELQEQAVSRQEKMGKVYMRMVILGLLLIVFIVALIIYLLGKLRW